MSFQTAITEDRRLSVLLPEAQRRGDDFGSPFFGLRFFGDAKKGDCAAGRTSRLGMLAVSSKSKGSSKITR